MTNNPSEKLLKMSEAANRLNVSKSTVYRLIVAGTLPAIKIGKQIRIKPADLEAYITGAQATNPDAGGAAA